MGILLQVKVKIVKYNLQKQKTPKLSLGGLQLTNKDVMLSHN